jgi:hypothetical protein
MWIQYFHIAFGEGDMPRSIRFYLAYSLGD